MYSYIPQPYMYTDGQKKLYSKIVGHVLHVSQTQAAQAYHDQNLESILGVISSP